MPRGEESRAERGLTLMHATPVAASQVEDEASPLLMCASASFSLFQTEELVPRLGFVVSWSRSLSSLLDWYFTHRGMEYLSDCAMSKVTYSSFYQPARGETYSY